MDTITAIATPPGRGAIGIVRVSGPAAAAIGRIVAGPLPAPRAASLRAFRNEHRELLDHGLAIYFPAPQSFTGEDMLELQAHGGPVVLAALLQAVLAAGARAARPGEFSERAFLNGKIDLLQAEAIADLINSASQRAARAAANALQGEFSRTVATLVEQLKRIRVQIEASIDFAEEALGLEHAGVLLAELAGLRSALAALSARAHHGAALAQGLDVLILGMPNTGKSTLLNQLAGEERAIVNALPGTTRDVLSVDIAIEGLPLRIHDTAGIRDSADAIEQEGVRRARGRLERCDLILHVVEAGTADPGLVALIGDAPSHAACVIRIRNKIDLTGEAATSARSADGYVLALSARTGAGLDLLRQAILEVAGLTDLDESPFIARERHIAALERAWLALAPATAEALAATPELIAEQLRQAQQALAEMTGEYTTEDLLGDIFSRFCIGK